MEQSRREIVIASTVEGEKEVVRCLDTSLLPPKKYYGSIKKYLGRARETLSYFSPNKEGEWTFQNPFVLVHLNTIGLLPHKARLATRKDLVDASKYSRYDEFLVGIWACIGLALTPFRRGGINENTFLARRIQNQLMKQGVSLGEEEYSGKFIPLVSLGLSPSEKSPHGLAFNIKDPTLVRNLEDLFGGNREVMRYRLGAVFSYSSYSEDLFGAGDRLADGNEHGRAIIVYRIAS